jgi:hypothetical protein
MKTYDVQSVSLHVSRKQAFAFISDARCLPRWTSAFAAVDGKRALMRTPAGEVLVDLEVHASSDTGSIDWAMTFPDGTRAGAYSRVVELGPDHCVYTFVLTPPPVALEQLEGTLEVQSGILAGELRTLKDVLEHAR